MAAINELGLFIFPDSASADFESFADFVNCVIKAIVDSEVVPEGISKFWFDIAKLGAGEDDFFGMKFATDGGTS